MGHLKVQKLLCKFLCSYANPTAQRVFVPTEKSFLGLFCMINFQQKVKSSSDLHERAYSNYVPDA